MKCLASSLLSIALFICHSCSGQSPTLQDTLNFQLGTVTPDDFKTKTLDTDTAANAVVLVDIGTTELEGYEYGFRTVFKHFRRVRILNKRGFAAATVALDFSASDNGEKRLKNLKATTYNLEGGQVIRTEVEKKDFFVDKEEGDAIQERFSFPNVKEGSVIEYTYTIRSSHYFKLRPWYFQGVYPTLLSMYTVKIPDIFNYVFLFMGHHPDDPRSSVAGEGATVAGNTWFKSHIQSTTWTMKDIPAAREEPFTFSQGDHISQVRFQLSRIPRRPGVSEAVLGDWKFACNALLYEDQFGKPLSEKNSWLSGEMNNILGGATSKLEKANKIFWFVRDNFNATGKGIYLSSETSLEKTFRKRSGRRADINLLLIAMLQFENIEADPVILSTRENGVANTKYPIMEDFNYVVGKVSIDGKSWYLDASDPHIGFGKLPLDCYNGVARVVSKNTYPVDLRPDSLTETKTTTVFLYNGEDHHMDITCSETPGYYESAQVREEATQSSTEYIKKLVKELPPEMTMEKGEAIDSLLQYDLPITLHYNMRFDFSVNDQVYFPPMLQAGMKTNPFIAVDRSYPVELPYKMDETYVLNMEMPKGYKVEEMPKSVKVKLNDEDGFFEYIISANTENILVKSRLVLNKTVFDPADYPTLRDFFAFVVKQQNELIVFKKL